ncbi:gp53-like domain-containing protein [Pseudoclavibacter terrae]|uniref:Putative tail fiber protein gp53-like C-terminal domain-containing protein n=1 Tax=Pseudoclavibacter terrae TaxID=1530195 RepID=A0A7J5B7E8_9MICO|nr:hypothetical protein [Pseudoclavibacter terrae]KAB1639873.1 hypothetical protein F8O03_06070 [Pseudoclavibacter terrae]
MAVNSYGPKGRRIFDGNRSPDTAVDLTELGIAIAQNGNRKTGTRLERLALTDNPSAENQRWEGLEFYQTDGSDAGSWIFTGGEWKRQRLDFRYQQDGDLPPDTPRPPVIQAANELIVQSGDWRFATVPQTETGGEYSPWKNFDVEFPNGCLAVQFSPYNVGDLPPGVPYLYRKNKAGFMLRYPGFVGIRHRAVNWIAFGY